MTTASNPTSTPAESPSDTPCTSSQSLASDRIGTFIALCQLTIAAAEHSKEPRYAVVADMLVDWLADLEAEVEGLHSENERLDSMLGKTEAELALARTTLPRWNERVITMIVEAIGEVIPPYHQGDTFRLFTKTLAEKIETVFPSVGEEGA